MTNGNLAARAKGAIEAFFEVFGPRTVIGLVLPDGWLGKPYDNYYELQGVSAIGGLLEIDLGWGWKVSMIPSAVELSEDRCSLTVSGSQISASTIDRSWRYDGGAVSFVVSSTSAIVKSTVEERAERLASSVSGGP